MNEGTNSVELFHLLFLRFLEQKLPKQAYALKGGCNLRFFFRSIRYSEDIDLDAWGIDLHALRSRVNQVLKSVAFQEALTAQGLRMLEVREHKQTETTQRWKMSIEPPNGGTPYPTKIEFSKRAKNAPEGVLIEMADPLVVSRYRLPPTLIPHYSLTGAVKQKVRALLDRKEPQARDVFDLDLLLSQVSSSSFELPSVRAEIAEIEERIFSLNFELFQSQVVAYLEPRYQEHYSQRSTWEEMQLKLLERIKQL